MKILTPLQHEQFQREGYLILERYQREADLQPMLESLNARVDQLARQLLGEGRIRVLHEEQDFETRLAGISRESREAFHAINGARWDGTDFFWLLTHPRLLDLAEEVVGPEVFCHTATRFRPKLPDACSVAMPRSVTIGSPWLALHGARSPGSAFVDPIAFADLTLGNEQVLP